MCSTVKMPKSFYVENTADESSFAKQQPRRFHTPGHVTFCIASSSVSTTPPPCMELSLCDAALLNFVTVYILKNESNSWMSSFGFPNQAARLSCHPKLQTRAEQAICSYAHDG